MRDNERGLPRWSGEGESGGNEVNGRIVIAADLAATVSVLEEELCRRRRPLLLTHIVLPEVQATAKEEEDMIIEGQSTGDKKNRSISLASRTVLFRPSTSTSKKEKRKTLRFFSLCCSNFDNLKSWGGGTLSHTHARTHKTKRNQKMK